MKLERHNINFATKELDKAKKKKFVLHMGTTISIINCNSIYLTRKKKRKTYYFNADKQLRTIIFYDSGNINLFFNLFCNINLFFIRTFFGAASP